MINRKFYVRFIKNQYGEDADEVIKISDEMKKLENRLMKIQKKQKTKNNPFKCSKCKKELPLSLESLANHVCD